MSLRTLLRRWFRWSRKPVVLGLPGSGKSTLVSVWPEASLATSAPRRATPVVYLIDARALCGCLAWVEGRNLELARQEIASLQARRIVIAVTNADQDCRISLMNVEIGLELTPGDGPYRELVTQELFQRNALGGRHARVVAGTLRDAASARALVSAITAELNR